MYNEKNRLSGRPTSRDCYGQTFKNLGNYTVSQKTSRTFSIVT